MAHVKALQSNLHATAEHLHKLLPADQAGIPQRPVKAASHIRLPVMLQGDHPQEEPLRPSASRSSFDDLAAKTALIGRSSSAAWLTANKPPGLLVIGAS